MISLLIFALVVLLICAVVAVIVRLILSALNVGQPWINIAMALILLIALLVILQRSGLITG